jgi:hypothetical protein
MAIGIEFRKSENVQTMLTRAELDRVEAMRKSEGYSLSGMVRVLILESLKVWEESQAGRKRKKSVI